MRTTIAIDDDLLLQAKRIARSRHVSVGRVVSEVMRRGLELAIVERDGQPVFDVPPSARRITAEHVREAEDTW